MGQAVPHTIGRHVHAKARPDETTPTAPVKTGIDYLHLVEQQHTAELAERVQYSQLATEPVPDGHVRGQLPLPVTDSEPIEHSADGGPIQAGVTAAPIAAATDAAEVSA